MDEKTGVRVEVLSMLYRELERSRAASIPWIWLRGNHEIGVKTEPHKTYMTLFQAVCYVIVEPAVFQFPDYVLFFLPWYLPQPYIEAASNMAKLARTYQGRLKILISHIGLDEGKASPSNMYVNQAVSLKHLEVEAYDLVSLWDYHVRQQLTPNCGYGGVPISHCHGDDLNNGVWLLDTAANIWEPIGLGERFPQHRTWEPPDPRQSILGGYDPQDYNRIIVPAEWARTYETLYLGATVQKTGEGPNKTIRRLACLEEKTNPGIWKKCCELKNYPKGVLECGLTILGEVPLRNWETTK